MTKKFHVAMFCSEPAYPERRTFYGGIFGTPSYEGPINEGSGSHNYDACVWEQSGLCFALLTKSDLTGATEQLAHIGFIFDVAVEFDSETKRRGIEPHQIEVLSGGQRQVFVRDESGTEWEFSCSKN